MRIRDCLALLVIAAGCFMATRHQPKAAPSPQPVYQTPLIVGDESGEPSSHDASDEGRIVLNHGEHL